MLESPPRYNQALNAPRSRFSHRLDVRRFRLPGVLKLRRDLIASYRGARELTRDVGYISIKPYATAIELAIAFPEALFPQCLFASAFFSSFS